MKKFLIMGTAAVALAMGITACADTTTGKVVKMDGNMVTIRHQDGSEKTLKTTPDTTYRKKEVMKHGKKHHDKMSADASYKPMIEEDDFIEIIYSPSTGNEWIIEDVVIYDN